MKRLERLMVVMIILMPLFGCSTDQKYTMIRMMTPEVSGDGTSRVDLTVTEAVKLKPSPNILATPLENEPSLESTTAVHLKNHWSFTDFMDLELGWGLQQSLITALKFQLLGASSKNAGAGNFSLGLRVGYGILVSGGSFSASEVEGSNPGRSYILESGHGVFDIMMGYRLSSSILVYGGYFLDNGRFNLKFKSGVRDSLINEIEASGYSFGLQYQMGRLLFNLSGASGEFIIEEKDKRKSTFDLGLSLSLLY